MDFRPRFRYPIAIALLAAFLISTGASPARAAGIGDYAAPFQSVVSAFENVFAQLVALVEPHHTVTVEISPAAMGTWHAFGKTASAAAFNSIVATSQPAASPTIVHVDTPPKTSTPKTAKTASVVVAPSLAKAPLAQLASYVTQTDLTTQLQELQNKLTSLVYQNVSAPNSVIATGGITNEIAATNRINQLSGVAITGGTITNATINGISGLTAADIPALAYLSTSGGSLSGALGIGTTSPSDLFALNGAAYLADIAVPPVTTNRLYSNSGSLYWAGNLLAGATTGNWSSDGTNVWRVGGNVGIGTTSASALLTIDSNSTLGSIIRLSNSSAGGHVYDLLETGSANTGGAGRLDFFDKTAGAARLSIAANGNVGIGTTSPSATFAVNGSGYFSGTLTGQVEDQGGAVFNVKSFGAKGDGVTDDTAAVTAAFAALGSGKGTVYVPQGDYLINNSSGPFTIANFNGAVSFAGGARFVFSSNTQGGLFFTGRTGATLNDIDVVYQTAPTARVSGCNAIRVSTATDTVITNIKVENSCGIGFLFLNSVRPKAAKWRMVCHSIMTKTEK